MVSFDAADVGTDEEAWGAAGIRDEAAPLDIGAIQRLVVLAAHPDDESLTAGGLVHAVAAAGRPVVVVVATFGEASHPRSRSTSPGALADRRRRELHAAVGILAPGHQLELLHLPDGGLSAAREQLVDLVRGILRPGDTVVAPWRRDGHPDHEVLGAVAAEVTSELGAMLLEAPIWAWHWGTPLDGWPRAVRFDLDGQDQHAKAAALAAHVSQTEPLSPDPGDEALLTPGMLEHFRGPSELFFPSGSSPVDFDAMYRGSDDPWGFADRWYERRKRALTVHSLPAERYRRALEIGCSTGLLTERLADRVDEILALDVADRAVRLARDRFDTRPSVRVERRRLPGDWPDGPFDLVVLSETGFYLTRAELEELGDWIGSVLEPSGVVVLCHWRPHVAGLEVAGDEVHELIAARLDCRRLVRHLEDDFVLDVLQVPPSSSVAVATGLR